MGKIDFSLEFNSLDFREPLTKITIDALRNSKINIAMGKIKGQSSLYSNTKLLIRKPTLENPQRNQISP